MCVSNILLLSYITGCRFRSLHERGFFELTPTCGRGVVDVDVWMVYSLVPAHYVLILVVESVVLNMQA